MSQTDDDELLGFVLGFRRAYQRTQGKESLDAAFVNQLFGAMNRTAEDVQVDWSSEGAPRVRFRDDGGALKELPSSCQKAFARGVLSASLVLTEGEGGSPVLQLLDAKDPESRGALSALGSAMDDDALREGPAALDLLGRIVQGAPCVVPSIRNHFEDWRCRVAHVEVRPDPKQVVRAQVLRPDAVVPHKEHISDSGYDLTLLYEKKRLGRTILFGTGVIIEPPFGWYFDVVPRSSIIKRGYILANSVGVIDRSYRGEIFVPLIKIDPDAPELEMPARVVQLIPRPVVHFEVARVESLSVTQRGAGGFGSTGT